MSDTNSEISKKIVLNRLNSIINSNKEYYESRKFKLISAKTQRSRKSSRNSNSDCKLKLPCWITAEAFETNLELANENTFAFIQKLIKENKNYFINCIRNWKLIESNDAETNHSASNIILDLLDDIVESIEKPPNTLLTTTTTTISFAENLITELFDELRLNSDINYIKNNKYELPDFVIDTPHTSTDGEGDEEHDTLDDMSSLNSSVGSHCRQLFVQNILVKRRHSADVVRFVPNRNLLSRHSESSDLLTDDFLIFPKHNETQNNTRRHSINSFGHLQTGLLNNSTINNISIEPKTKNQKNIKKQPNNSNYKPILKRYHKLVVKKTLKRILSKIVDTYKNPELFDIVKNENNRIENKPSQTKTDQFLNTFFEEIWNESMNSIKSIKNNIKLNFVDNLVEEGFNDAFIDFSTISQCIQKTDRFFFRCECCKADNSSNKDNINCLLSVYFMMIALSDYDLSNQITFICSHFN